MIINDYQSPQSCYYNPFIHFHHQLIAWVGITTYHLHHHHLHDPGERRQGVQLQQPRRCIHCSEEKPLPADLPCGQGNDYDDRNYDDDVVQEGEHQLVSTEGGFRQIEHLQLNFYGVKSEAQEQRIQVARSQSLSPEHENRMVGSFSPDVKNMKVMAYK